MKDTTYIARFALGHPVTVKTAELDFKGTVVAVKFTIEGKVLYDVVNTDVQPVGPTGLQHWGSRDLDSTRLHDATPHRADAVKAKADKKAARDLERARNGYTGMSKRGGV